MIRHAFTAVLAWAMMPLVPASAETLKGEAAFNDWTADAPGLRRHITVDDLPPPFATRSTGNGPSQRARPEGAVPQVPEGFDVELLAEGLIGPRTLLVASNGDVFIAESPGRQISVLRREGGETSLGVFAGRLDAPYGMAFYPSGPNPEWLYVAETNRVVRFPYRNGDLRASGRPEVIVERLPTGGHWTRDIAFSPDGKELHVAVGSLSNVAVGMAELRGNALARHEELNGLGASSGAERDRAAVLTFTPEGERIGVLANGLRNCSGVTIQPATGDLWCVVNERDGLGDNLPPDYATSVKPGGFYGWPWYYMGGHQDPRHKGARPELAGEVDDPDVLFQAHSAPLGMVFYQAEGEMAFPEAYDGDAFAALHGSWNRSERTGYKVVRLMMESGVATGAYEDFMTGFVISDRSVWGRPVDVAVDADGALLVSEDGAGTIWRVFPKAE